MRNGLFTRVLLKDMAKPGLPIREVLHRVRNEAAALAGSVRHAQVPAVHDQVRGSFYVVPPVLDVPAAQLGTRRQRGLNTRERIQLVGID